MTNKATPTENDRRSRQRVPIRVPVKVRHQGHEHAGLTRDLSSSGIFLYSESAIKAGSKLDLVIMLPPGLGLGPGGWTLCQASVVGWKSRMAREWALPLPSTASNCCRRSAKG